MGLPSCACVPPDGDDWSGKWPRECDHHRAQRIALEVARGTLADIYESADMTMEIARQKAGRVYLETAPNEQN